MSRRERTLFRRQLIKKKPSSFLGNIGVHESSASGSTSHSQEHASGEHNSEKHPSESHSKKRNFLLEFYDKKYKSLLVIPIILLLLSVSFLGIRFVTKGSFIDLGVSITGGISVTADGKITYSLEDIESLLHSKFPNSDISVRWISSTAGEKNALSLEMSGVSENEILPVLKQYLGESLDYSVEETGSSLAKEFFRQMLIALLLAFLIMGVVVFVSFKSFVPSLAVISCAVADMIMTLAAVSFLDVKLSLSGIAAFLMLIGYSVETDILLTSRVLRGKTDSIFERVLSALNTGITMTLTTIVAVLAGLIFTQSPVLKQIMLILLVGCFVDMINTWIQNVVIIRMYAENHPELYSDGESKSNESKGAEQ
jgi:preprotein translocase subunit SecF